VNVDGTDERKLTNSGDNYSPQYLSDNTIIFSSSQSSSTVSGWSGIYSMNADGTGKKLLTQQGLSFGDPRISPDKRKIALTSLNWNGSQIYVMNTDGSNMKQLTFSVSPTHNDIGFPRNANSSPEWSPNSRSLVYVSYQRGNPDICIVNADGTRNKKLTSSTLRDENPCWTPDGQHIIFSSNRNMAVSSEIYIMKAGGQLQTPLTHYVSDDIFPSFIKQ
jgi:TolB protein